MSKNKKNFSQGGFSLVQVMIAGALMVGMAVVGMRMAENQSKQNRGAQQSSEATSFYTLVSSLMAGKQACTNTFANLADQIPAMGAAPLVFDEPIKDSKQTFTNGVDNTEGLGNILFRPGSTYGALNFVGMEVENTSFDIANTNSGLLQVRLKFRRELAANQQKRTTYGSNEFSRNLLIFINVDEPTPGDPKVFKDCYDISESIIYTVASGICADLGGSYDPTTRICDPATIYQNPTYLKLVCEGFEYVWDEVEQKCNKYVRGGQYGGCSKELLVDTTFKGTYNQVWPVLNCSTNPPTCDVGFRAVQLAGGLVNVTPFGELTAEMSTIWETWACSKE